MTGLSANTTYYVRAYVTNAYGTSYGSQVSFSTDVTAPTVSTLSPLDGATNIGINDDLMITFNEAVSVGTGNIVIKKTSDDSIVESIDVTGSQVTGGGTSSISVNPSVTLAGETGYYIEIDPTAFTDPSGNSYAGISDKTSWNFTTQDVTAPTLSTLSPLDGATGVGVNDDLVITFDKVVNVGTGNIVIKKASDDSTVESIDVTGSQVTGGGTSSISVNPSVTLAGETGYYVEIDSTAFVDPSGNSYAGISDKTSWNFTTEDITAPTVSSLSPLDGASNVGINDDLVITFSEAVNVGTGNVVIKKTSDDSAVESIDVTGSQVTGGGTSSISVNPSVTLAGETGYYVEIDSTAFVDLAGNSYSGISDTTSWNFTTKNIPSDNALLSGLSINSGTLTPTFDKNVVNYTVQVPYEISEIILTPTVENTGKSTVKVNEVSVESGTSSGPISLKVGHNTVDVVVTAQDRMTEKTYSITVIRGEEKTYSIQLINNQTLTPLEEGYGSGTQETKTIVLTKTGSGKIESLKATLSGSNADAFEITQPMSDTLTDERKTTKLTVKAKDQLAAGTYEGTVTVTADKMDDVVFTVEQEVKSKTSEVPEVPVIHSATPGNEEVTIQWSGVENALSYQVYSTTTSGAYEVAIGSVTDRGSMKTYTYTQEGLTNGIPYYYVVRAVNEEGIGAISNEVTATPRTVPGAPRDVTANPSNQKAYVYFNKPNDDGGAPITNYIVVSTPGAIEVTGISSPIEVSGLTNGTSYSFKVIAVNSAGESLPSILSAAVVPKKSESTGKKEENKTEETPEPGSIVIVNGKEENMGKENVTGEDGDKTATISIDTEAVNKKIEEALKDTDTGEENMVEVASTTKDAKKVMTNLNGEVIKKMEDHAFKLSIQSEDITYIISAKEVGIDNVAKEIGVASDDLSSIEVEVAINRVSDQALSQLEKITKANDYELVFPPVTFEITAKTKTIKGEEKEVKITKFNQYVERVLRIPDGVDPKKITTGVIYNEDGTISHIPTNVFEKNGVYYARLNSMTNSNYSVIENEISVESVKDHWAKEAVNDMAKRLVIEDSKGFKPDEEITRAEFAVYITKAIGIYRTGMVETQRFTDVDVNHTYAKAVEIAVQYGIINGYLDGTFKPEAKISREEAMAMYARTMEVIGLEVQVSDKIDHYTDKDDISTWAYADIKKVVSAGVFNGKTETTINPKDTFTYAEAAVAIRNLLIKADLINE